MAKKTGAFTRNQLRYYRLNFKVSIRHSLFLLSSPVALVRSSFSGPSHPRLFRSSDYSCSLEVLVFLVLLVFRLGERRPSQTTDPSRQVDGGRGRVRSTPTQSQKRTARGRSGNRSRLRLVPSTCIAVCRFSVQFETPGARLSEKWEEPKGQSRLKESVYNETEGTHF